MSISVIVLNGRNATILDLTVEAESSQESSHVRQPPLFQRRRVYPGGEGHPVPQGLAEAYAHVEDRGGWRTEVDEGLAAFLAESNSFYFATASAEGQPYIQHRGGPKGFIKVLDKNTLAFADYSGNRQYITQGNLSENRKAYIFVMDYAHRRRVKLWGEARVVEDDDALLQSLMPKGYRARPRAGDPVSDRSVGHQLPAAHSAEIRCRRRGRSTRLTRCAHCGA